LEAAGHRWLPGGQEKKRAQKENKAYKKDWVVGK